MHLCFQELLKRFVFQVRAWAVTSALVLLPGPASGFPSASPVPPAVGSGLLGPSFWRRLQLHLFQQFCPLFPTHVTLHQWSSSHMSLSFNQQSHFHDSNMPSTSLLTCDDMMDGCYLFRDYVVSFLNLIWSEWTVHICKAQNINVFKNVKCTWTQFNTALCK